MGYAAKGIVYLIIGVMAGLFALGRRNQPGDATFDDYFQSINTPRIFLCQASVLKIRVLIAHTADAFCCEGKMGSDRTSCNRYVGCPTA
jgi:hypothetical protein